MVEAIVDIYSDGGSDMTHSNYVAIRHEDGTVAGYGHTRQNGSVVHVGQRVAQGQLIVHAGSSGTAGFPHLHVGVFPTTVWRRTDDLPFSFRNASGPVDQRGALIVGATYVTLQQEHPTHRAARPARGAESQTSGRSETRDRASAFAFLDASPFPCPF